MALFCLAYVSRTARAIYAAGFILMGITLEFLQGMTGYRTFDVLDMLANAVGVGGAWFAAEILTKRG